MKTKESKTQLTPRVTRELNPLSEVDRMFDALFEGGFLSPFHRHWPEWSGFGPLEERLPHIDIINRDDTLVVRAEIPGIAKKDLDITLSNDLLTIKGESREESEETGEFYRAEIHRGRFTRSVRLPDEVLSDKAKARFEDGILEITIPKAAKASRHNVKVE